MDIPEGDRKPAYNTMTLQCVKEKDTLSENEVTSV
jgi:hypothetical protein